MRGKDRKGVSKREKTLGAYGLDNQDLIWFCNKKSGKILLIFLRSSVNGLP